MVLVIYLLAFAGIFLFRRRMLVGHHLGLQTMDGAEYLEHLSYEGKNKTSVSPTLGLFLQTRHHFIISREKWYHRMLKALGLASEIETGDDEIDRTLFFMTDRPDHLQMILQKADFRRHVRDLFLSHDAKNLRAFGERIWVRCTSLPTKAMDRQYKIARLRSLQALANDLDASLQSVMQEPQGWLTRPQMAMLFMAAHAGLFFLGLCAGLPLLIETVEIVDAWQLVYYSLPVAAGAAAFWCFVLFSVFGRSSWLPLIAGDFILMGLAGFFLSTVFTLREINHTFDHAAPEIHAQTVIGKSCELECSRGSGKRRHSSTYSLSESQCHAAARPQTLAEYSMRDSKCGYRSSFSYEITITPWLPEQKENFEFSVDSQRFDSTRKGDILKVPSHKGALSLAWVDTDEIKP